MAGHWGGYNSYLKEKQVPELLEALTAGLVHHRPRDHYGFLLRSLDHVKEVGTENLRWDTFVTSPPEVVAGNSRGDHVPRVRCTAEEVKAGNESSVKPGNVELAENDLFNIDTGLLFVEDEASNSSDKQLEKEIQGSEYRTDARFNSEKTKNSDDKTDSLHVPSDHIIDGDQSKSSQKKTGPKRKFSWQRREFVSMATSTPAPTEDSGPVDDGQTAGQWEAAVAEMSEQTLAPNITDPVTLEVIKGSFNNTPLLPTNTVRIFLSSTFSDFRAERNILPKKAYPKIQEFCRERGLEFQVLDMRWGVTDEMMNDHQVTSLCIREIHSCQQVSCGPSFVALVGNRYGYRPFPSSIDAEEFDVLIKVADKMDPRGCTTVKEWFQRNDNVVPPVYELQPIASKFAHYNEKGSVDLYTKDRHEWQQIFDILHSTLQAASEGAHKAGLLKHQETVKYNISVTEDEIQNGLINVKDAKTKALCFQRNLKNLNNYLDESNTGRFVELTKNEKGDTVLDKTAQNLLSEMVTKKIPKAVEGDIQRKYELEWKGVRLEDSEDTDQQAYLAQFTSDFITDMTNLIDLNYKRNQVSVEQEYKHLLYEVVHHTKFAKSKLELFCGRKEEIDKIRGLLQTPGEENEPIIVHAPSGYGKTSLLAKCASMVKQWFQADTVTVLRFLGTSAESSNIRSTLLSVMSQLYAVLNYTMPADSKLEKMGDVRRYFWNVLTILGEKNSETQFVIMLDSIDQLAEMNGALKLTWLPRSLPPNVNIILSFVTDMYSCLDYAKQKIKSESHYVELPLLSSDVGEDIMKTFQSIHNCGLTSEQSQIVLNAFKLCSGQPLYLKLLLDESTQWTSYMNMNSLNIPRTVHDAISKMFEDLEVKYGEVFVTHALSYLTSGLGGLTDIEMDDVLSCDDEVLNEVYQYHDPPLEGTIRVPALMWARLGFELKYLTERQVDEKTVRTWYHRQFLQVAEKRYLLDVSWKEKVHTNLAELFHQHEGIQRSVVLAQRQGKVIENADRLVTPQPLVVSNRRKLNALPYHLFHGKQFDLLKQDCLINFDFIFTKLQALGIGEVFSELEEYTKSPDLDNDAVLKTMRNFIEISFDAFHFDPFLFPFTVKERLSEFKEDHVLLMKIVNDAERWLVSTTKPLLLPTNPISITKLNSPIRFSAQLGYEGIMNAEEDVVVTTWKHSLTLSAKIMSFDLNNRDLLANIDLSKESPVCISPDNKHVVFFADNMAKVCEIHTGDCVEEISYLDDKYDNVTGRTIKFSSSGRYMVLVVKLGRPLSVPVNGTYRIMTGIYNIDMTEETIHCTNMIKFPAKKHTERIELVEDDSKLVALSRDKYLVFTFPQLEKVYECRETIKQFYGGLAKVYQESSTIFAPQELEKGCRYLRVNYETNKIEKGDMVHINSKGSEGCYPFGFYGNDDMTKFMMGTTSKNEVRENFLWIWHDSPKAEMIHIGKGDWKQGSCFVVAKDCKNCIIGWKNGDVSVVSLESKQEMCCIHGHAQDVPCLLFRENEKYLLSFASDHLMKIWDMKMLFEEANNRGSVLASIDQSHTENEEMKKLILDDSEQVVNLTATDDYVITASQLNTDGPKFWSVNDGTSAPLSENHDRTYKSSLDESGNVKIMKTQRYHADIALSDSYLSYIRKQRDHCFVYMTNVKEPKALAHRCFKECFFQFIASPAIWKASSMDPYMLLVQDGFVARVTIPELKVLDEVEMPKISEEFGKMHSSNTKRKLTYYKLATSVDGKYFIICNPSPGVKKGTQKYFDLIDIENNSNNGRIKMPDFTPWKILDDSYYYLLLFKSAEPQIHKPSTLSLVAEEPIYRCALYDGRVSNRTLSHDFTIGLEITKSNTIRVYDVETAVKMCNLKGHTSQITCTDISTDKCHMASGSYDNTVRLWSLETGNQLCLFCMYGTIDGLVFTPSTEHIIANYYSAPQRKRAAVLRLHNVK